MIRVLINGAFGKMGQATLQAVANDPELLLVAKLGSNDNLKDILKNTKVDVAIDFTTPSAVYNNTKLIIDAGIHPVIGTTGLSAEQITALQADADAKNLGGIIAPNFSIGAVLMMCYAREIARYFNQVEIIELHHQGKKDAPSGTALKTAAMIAEGCERPNPDLVFNESTPHARGTQSHNIPIHSVRLPGLIAHEEIIFGGHGETLTLRHDSIQRESFMPGVVLACKKVMLLKKLVYGLENVLWEPA